MNFLNFFIKEPKTSIGLLSIILISYRMKQTKIMKGSIALFLILIWFYRKPTIDIPKYMLQSNELYSPAYGTVRQIKHIDDKYHVEMKLELWDVHIQYFPTSGEVIDQVFKPYSVETKMRNAMWGVHSKDREIRIIQGTGYIARRIDTPQVKGSVLAGNELGMIKFGSHVKMVFSDKYRLLIRKGDSVYGPSTKIAVWN